MKLLALGWLLLASSVSPAQVSAVGPVRARPVAFTEPTTIDLEPGGTLLLVENNPGRVLRVNPGSGRVTVLAPSMSHPYAVVRARSGAGSVSTGKLVQRIDGGARATVAR